jgi:hypothetical protein
MRIPRKLKKKIPKNTPYCYSPDFKKNESQKELFPYWIKPCTFYTRKYQEGIDGWCNLIKCEVMDQCKSCGISQIKTAKI